MSLKECQRLAKECEILIRDEFNAALWFLHNKVGTIRYFENVPEVENVVITDPQLLFDLVTDLIVNTFSFGKVLKRMSEHDRFRFSGRFTKHHLEQCKAVKEKLLSVEQVIAVLEHLVIIASVGINESNEQEYFLPCVLVHASLPSTPLLHNDSDIPPLLITFKCQYTPRGIFSSLIARILLDGKDKWELYSEEIKRNQVDFCLIKSGHLVTISNFFRFLEIAVKSPYHATERSQENVFVVIKHYISHCLNDVRKQLNYSAIADHSFGFYCKKFNNHSADHHPAICDDNIKPTYTRCHLKCKFTSNLLPQHQLWFYNKFSSQQIAKILEAPKPRKHELLKFLCSTTAKWQEIGDFLGVDPDTIEGLCFSNKPNHVKMSEMLQSWLDNEPTPVTWENIISVLDGPLKKKSVGDEIRKFLDWT